MSKFALVWDDMEHDGEDGTSTQTENHPHERAAVGNDRHKKASGRRARGPHANAV